MNVQNDERLAQLTERILDQKEELAKAITEEQNGRFPLLRSLSNELLPLRVELVTLYGESLSRNELERAAEIRIWGEKTGTECANMGTTLESMLAEVPNYRNVIGQLIKEEATRLGYTIDEFYEAISILDQTVNEVVYYFCLPFVDVQNDRLKATQQSMNEMSVPVVPVSEGIAVLPLVGTIDTHRAKQIIEESLERCLALNIEEFVIDLSGVAIIDTFVAHKLFQVMDSLKLIGVKPKISGISPVMAQTIVQLGLDFKDIPSYATLKSALKEIGFQRAESLENIL